MKKLAIIVLTVATAFTGIAPAQAFPTIAKPDVPQASMSSRFSIIAGTGIAIVMMMTGGAIVTTTTDGAIADITDTITPAPSSAALPQEPSSAAS